MCDHSYCCCDHDVQNIIILLSDCENDAQHIIILLLDCERDALYMHISFCFTRWIKNRLRTILNINKGAQKSSISIHESPDRAVRDDMSLALESLPSESLPSAYKAAQRGKMMLSQYCRFQYRCRQHATGWWPACPGVQSHNQG